MIGYVTIGTNDFERAAAFYDELLGTIGAKRLFDMETFIAYAVAPDQPALSILRPHNGEAATPGNGTMVALRMKDTDQVDAFHAKALELGGTDEGAPGKRSDLIYAAYFRDLDGNKFNAYYMYTP